MTLDRDQITEYQTTDSEGNPVELQHIDSPTYERGVIRINRDQIKRDAERWIAMEDDPEPGFAPRLTANLFARHCLALLTELEQAEALAQRWELTFNHAEALRSAAEHRLAKTPALVEALNRIAMQGIGDLPFVDAIPIAREALAAWEAD